MSDTYCTDCKTNTEVVFDHGTGDTVCRECGLVLEAWAIDDTSEWRTFADDNNDRDPNRVGAVINPLFADAALTTIITQAPFKKSKGDDDDFNLSRLQNRGGDPDRAIMLAFNTISLMADRLSLVTTITDRANELYKRLDDQKCTRGRKIEALVAACIFIACRQEGKPRTVKEICYYAGGATKKEIGRAKEFIMKQLKVEMGEAMEIGTIHAGDYPRRFCSKLCMSHREMKAVEETVQNSGNFDIRRSPVSIAAGVIFMISQISDTKITLQNISFASTVAEGTIKNAYRDLYPHATKIIPEWYAKERDLNKLSTPRT